MTNRLFNTFEFVGNISIPKSSDKFLKVEESTSGWLGNRLNFAVKESNTNSTFVEMYGGYFKSKANVVKTLGKSTENNKGSNLEIPWDDRLKDETIDMVADFKKIVIDFTTDFELKQEINQLLYEIRSLEYKDVLSDSENEKLESLRAEVREKSPDRYTFIHPYDAVVLLSNKLEKYKDHKFKITGTVDYNYWNGNYYRKFTPQTLEIVESDTPSKLRSTMDIFFTKDALDEKDLKKDNKIYIDGYVLAYNSILKTDIFVPQQYVINTQKINFENEEHVKRLEFLKKKFNVTKNKSVHHLQWQVNIFRGADKVEFTEKDLTQEQKEAIEFGYNKLEDFTPKGGMLGDNIYENRLVKPNLLKINEFNDFTNGYVESDYSIEDLDIVPVLESKKEEKSEIKKEEPKVKVELEELFG